MTVLLTTLRAGNEEWEDWACEKLKRSRRADVPAIASLLGHDDTHLRWITVEVLEEIGEDAVEATPDLLMALEDEDEVVSGGASRTLGAIGRPAVEGLCLALQHKSSLVRALAVAALASMGPDAAAAVPALSRVVKDTDENVSESAVWALASVGAAAKEAVPKLIEKLKEEPGHGPTIGALVRIRPDESAIPFLTDILGRDPWYLNSHGRLIARIVGVREECIPETYKQSFGPCAIPALLKALRHESDEIREGAALLLGLFPYNTLDILSDLRTALKDTSGRVRGAAAYALGCLEDSSSLPLLLDALRDPDPKTRRWSLMGLGQLRAIGTVPALATATRDSNPEIQYAAVWALREMGCDATDAIPDLIRALTNEDPGIREMAARSLGITRASVAELQLVQALKDPVEEVRLAAKEALKSLRAETGK